MSPLNNTKVAWGVAIAALALWCTSAPVTWGYVASGAARLFDETQDTAIEQLPAMTDTSEAALEPCPPLPTVTETPAATTTTRPAAEQRTFNICGANAEVERAIAELVAGRGFSSSLSSRGDGCAELTIRVTSGVTSGSTSSRMSVSLGGGKRVDLHIVSENGATRATLTD